MIIVVNTRLLIPNKLDGIGRFTAETLARITTRHPEAHFVFLFDRPIDAQFIFSDNITPVKLMPPARRTWLFNIWLNFSVHGALRDLKPDLFLSPDGFLPLKGNTPMLPVIHDLNFEHYPEDLPNNITRWYKEKFPQFARKGTRVATVSEFSANDIASKYNIDRDKIDVLCNGADIGFRPLGATEITTVRNHYAQGKPYFLYVGALHPRKNLPRLIEAYGRFRKNGGSDIKLVIAGGNYWKYTALQEALKHVPNSKDVIFTGRVSDNALQSLTAGALALTYVPYFEGFGIPMIEAMQCDVPIVTADRTAMPEVAGDAALYVDPFSVESIATGLQHIAESEVLRQDLITKGRVRRQLYTWDKAADLLWNSMMKCIPNK
ncbi:MAG: glycosyltransferase family 4 protein [Bacteroidetes bacterium]|nr:glycosyltransferase family 4 protein [Bacteroidota bacterium]